MSFIKTKLIIFIVMILSLTCRTEDWPQFKNGGDRTASTSEMLPDKLQPRWTRQLPVPYKAWHDKSNITLSYDDAYEPVVSGKLMVVGSMIDNSVRAYNTQDGREAWSFYTEGPVRFSPAIDSGNVYVGSDDGYLYCLDLLTGTKKWKFLGGPATNKILGNNKMIGMWPIRTGVAVNDDKVYFAASPWPFMGTFIHCLNASTGKVVWTNSGDGMQFRGQPHSAHSFASVAPQGYISVTGDYIVMPSGRGFPGVFKKQDGEFLHFHNTDRQGIGRVNYYTSAAGQYFLMKDVLYSSETGKPIMSDISFIDKKHAYTLSNRSLIAYNLTKPISKAGVDRKGKPTTTMTLPVAWQTDAKSEKIESVQCKTGDKLYCINGKKIVAIKYSKTEANQVWSHSIAHTPKSLLIADNKLFVSTLEGVIYCFGGESKQVINHKLAVRPLKKKATSFKNRVTELVKIADDNSGFALIIGIGSGELIDQFLLQTKINLVVVDSDRQKVTTLRNRMSKSGLYGKRISAIVDDITKCKLPPYFASIITSEEECSFLTTNNLTKLFNHLRPYTGIMALGPKALSKLPNQLSKAGDTSYIKRPALPDSADWTHHYSDAQNSLFSPDKRVKLPMGLLWFGGNTTNDDILPRHGHGPSPQVAAGRLFIEGQHMLRCMDIYTGRQLWQQKFEEVGWYYRHTGHHPGAGEIGSNYVSMHDYVYLMYKDACLVLSAKTGKIVKTFRLPAVDGKHPHWGSIRIEGKYLIATIEPVNFTSDGKKSYIKLEQHSPNGSMYSTGSGKLVVLDRFTGKQLWSRRAEFNFRHNCLALNKSTIFCIDQLTAARLSLLKRRGIIPKGVPKLLALDMATGKVKWQTKKDVFGTFLSYSSKYDLLIQSSSSYRDRAKDEAKGGISVLNGKDGSVVWKDLRRKYSGPLMICGDQIVTNGNGGGAFDLKTGVVKNWKWERSYGCNTAIACENLLTFRSGAAGFYDLKNLGGTGNFGGFKSSCTSNIIPAGGILTIPDYTRTCSCAYQNQSSVALVHMPDLEYWTWGAKPSDSMTAMNLGAPGDRKEEKKLWIGMQRMNEMIAGSIIKITGGKPYCNHSSGFEKANDLAWVAASGIEGATTITLKLQKPKKGAIIKLYFSEPDITTKPGTRVFDVFVDGKKMISALDIVKEAGGSRKLLVKSLAVDISQQLKVKLVSITNTPIISAIEFNAVLPMPKKAPKLTSKEKKALRKKKRKK